MAGIIGSGSIPFIGCITLLATMVLQVLSYAAPFWAYDKLGDFGLWRKYRCIQADGTNMGQELGCYRQDHPWYYGDWLDAVRAMESLAIIFWAIPLVVLPIYIYIALGLYYRCLMGTMTALTLLGALCNLVGLIVYGCYIDKNDWGTGWCLILCVIADALGFLSFVILLISTCKRPKFELERYHTSEYFIDPDGDGLYVVEPVKDPSLFNGGGHINPAMSEN